ncbi:MAG: hypothetical protein K2J20_07020 [Bacilli bacterium]|nr:hypothetical protein [Bacilli bacterium]
MNILVDFLLNNYVWFLVISLILVFALIGYLVDMTTLRVDVKPKRSEVKTNIDGDKDIQPSVEISEEDNNSLINDESA